MRLTHLLTASIVSLLVFTGAQAQTQERIKDLIKLAGKAPATKPAAAGPKAPATVSPEAAPVLEKLSLAYLELKSLHHAGKITMVVQVDGANRDHSAEFVSWFSAPNKFTHESKGFPLIGSTGAKYFGYSGQTNGFWQIDASAEKALLRDMPAETVKILTNQDPALLLALSKNPAEDIKQLATAVGLAAGQGGPWLRLNLADGGEMHLFISAKSGLIERVTIDLKPGFAKAGRADVTSALLTITYDTVEPNAKTVPDQFAWTAPLGAKDLIAARQAAEEEMAEEGGPVSDLVGKPAPDFTLKGMDDKPVALSELKGSVVVLDFWATWCGPCVAALPHLDKVYQDMGKDGVKVFAVNQKEEKQKVEGFVERKKLTIPVLLDSKGGVGRLYNVTGIPQTVVIGKDGLVKKVIVGFNPDGDDALRELLAKELKAK